MEYCSVESNQPDILLRSFLQISVPHLEYYIALYTCHITADMTEKMLEERS